MEEQITFYKYPEKLMRATGYVSPKTGELIELTANEKNIYVVMKKRNTFFEKHFDKQEDISILSGVGLKQTGRILREFNHHGVIVAHRGSSGQYKNYRYEEVLDIELYYEHPKVKKSDPVKRDMIGSIGNDFWKSEQKQVKKVSEWRGSAKPQTQPAPQQHYEPTPSWVDMEDPF